MEAFCKAQQSAFPSYEGWHAAPVELNHFSD
jgi:hypothetical protein